MPKLSWLKMFDRTLRGTKFLTIPFPSHSFRAIGWLNFILHEIEIGELQYLFNLGQIVRFYYCFVLGVKARLTSGIEQWIVRRISTIRWCVPVLLAVRWKSRKMQKRPLPYLGEGTCSVTTILCYGTWGFVRADAGLLPTLRITVSRTR